MQSSMIRLSFWLSCLAIGVLSLLPVAYLPPAAFDWWDKAQHALAFLCLGALGLAGYPDRVTRVLAGLLLYGALIEVLQALTGWRYGEWQDWLADALGVLFAELARRALRRLAPRASTRVS
jgi:VanZ family protein